jgi:hypothetical protein
VQAGIGNAAEIRTKRGKQKTGTPDAQLLLGFMIEDRVLRIWVPDSENHEHLSIGGLRFVASYSAGAESS